ncbi:calcium-binding protein [Nocardioides sp.]|uniref:calcium-binding protein n=1 Tax=Nocardioides sp. TaxID=35761 RepID=UPI002721D158|nr:calcium-binding protein [Nocardioides sp.]MDO9455448.1 calcium-binding protein [Nocardioides sp.]
MATGALVVGGGQVLAPAAAGAAAAAPDDDASARRIGVIALTSAISAVGQTPELSTPLPFTTTALADVLGLDKSLAGSLQQALLGTDLETALDAVEGISLVDDADDETIAFTYDRTVTTDLALVHDDGDLRFGSNDGAGKATVALTTDEDSPFVVAVDPAETDPLLRVALVSQPVLDLSVDIDTDDLAPFSARQGFTALDVTGGHYRVHRDQQITMRDPDGRGVLTLEDLRFSTLPDLFRVTTGDDDLDVALDVKLPDSLAGGTAAERSGTLAVTGDSTPDGDVWPTAEDATRTYGATLTQATGLSMADGLTSLAQYTGTVLALQDAADVPFPHLGGGTSDLFSPGDRLLELLSTAASAQVVCGVSPGNPPTGVAAPGDTVYCQATTAQGLGGLTGVSWSLNDGGTIVSSPTGALGETPSDVVEVSGSDGEPDLQVSFTAGGQQLVARSMPQTVQDVVSRIEELDGSDASASLTAGRLDVAVGITQASRDQTLELGNASTLGALVGLTGLKSADPDNPDLAQARATGASFDVGFGIQTGTPAEGAGRQTYLLPKDRSLLQVDGLSATPPRGVTGLPARIGFLGVKADLTGLGLGKAGSGPAVELARVTADGTEATDPLPISDLLTEDGALDPDQLTLTSQVTASIGFTATEQALSGTTFATGTPGGAQGSASVSWNAAGLPSVTLGDGYARLRVFDPVPAAFLGGTARVKPGSRTAADVVRVDVTSLPAGTTLYAALNVAPPTGAGAAPVEVARHLQSEGVACQNVTILDADTLTCDDLAPNGRTPWADGQAVQVIVLGDAFALRDSVIEGLASSLADFDRLTGDNVTESPAVPFDQYSSTLPLVDLTPSQLAVEREALRQGIAAMDQAATEDEQGTSATPVSSAQELSAAVGGLVRLGSAGGYDPSLAFDLGTQRLGVRLVAHAPTGTRLSAPLRLDDAGATGRPGRGQVASGSTAAGPASVPVDVTSTTTLAISVDRTTARHALADATASYSTARVTRTGAQLAGHPLQAGVSALGVLAAGTSADLGVRVLTDYVVAGDGTGRLETRRSNARTTGRAAVAKLAVGTGDVIDYAADATTSSGGAGAAQPARDAMQVRFLAEGLDGLADALGSATDGAAPRNLDPATGTPVSAPLIGTDLDAGAGVPDILTALTSSLRTELTQPAVTGVTKATDLKAVLDDAVDRAVDGTEGLEDIAPSDVTVTVTCGGTNGACTACPAPPTDGTTAPVCTTDGATGWDTVTISTKLTGVEKAGKTPFETGLAGLEVRSNIDIDTTTSWTLPITLQLKRGVGPQVVVGSNDALELDVAASIPDGGIDAIVGYLPAHLSVDGAGRDGSVETTIAIKPTAATYDLFDLYDGALTAKPSFTGADEEGLSLGFDTLAQDKGVFGMSGYIDIPWSAADGFTDEVTYNDVKLDVGDVVAAIATPFQVVDPYLAPIRDVVDVLRSPIPVISDLSELAGGDEVSLLSLLETLSAATEKPQLELAHRVIGLVGGVTDMIHGLSVLADGDVGLEDLAEAGAVLSLDPSDVSLYEKCTQTVSTSRTTAPTTPGGTPTTATTKTKPQPCPDDDALADEQAKPGAPGQTTADNRLGKRNTKTKVATKTREITGQLPGFSLPFLTDPDQLLDVLTGEGEASYFRLDLGTLSASVAYTQKFGPIMAGPVPIVPFVGGSISVEGRLAMGFDSYAQTLAAQAVKPGAVGALLETYTKDFDGGDVIREGFYIDDLDAEGVDVPEVKVVTTLEAGAGVSVGIVTAGLKGGITLTINLDLNDPDDDGRLRTAEIRDIFAGDAGCIFDASAEIEAYISVFVEIELLLTSLEYEFDLLRLGPYELFSYGCPDLVPSLVVRNSAGTGLLLNSGPESPNRLPGSGAVNDADLADEYEVRQFDQGGGLTTYEVSGFGRVQNVDVKRNSATSWAVTIYESGLTTSTEVASTFTTSSRPTFQADGGQADDQISFLAGEDFAADGALVTTPFDTRITSLTGGPGDDQLVTGDGDDSGIDGGLDADNIDTGLGDDSATGGAGNDVVGGGAGRDDIRGGANNDRLEGGPGADRVDGEGGNDSLVGGSGRDVRSLLVRPRGSADDVVSEQVRLGFDSGDVLVGGSGADTVDGGDGSDVVVGGESSSLTGPTVTMGSLFGTGQRTVDVLVEGASSDDDAVLTTETVPVLTANVPSDSRLDNLCVSGTLESGSSSTDFVTGGAEKDVVVGGNGPDTLDGGSGPDEICGLAGDDQISGDGAEGDDENDDVIRGGAGNDRSDGGPGDDVIFGDDVTLVRGGTRVLDGSLGGTGTGSGQDFLDGGEGDDVLAGGDGSDQLVGGVGDDAAFGEGRDTADTGGAAPPVAERLVACNATTRVVRGLVDLDGDLFGGGGGSGLTADTGRMAGLDVVDGTIGTPGSSASFDGLLGGDVVVIGGRVDLDRDGTASDDDDDTGVIDLPSMLGTGTNTDGDCILTGDGNDDLRGGKGSDYLGAGDGTDLLAGGDGNDLALGDGGTDVLLGGQHQDVLVGGTGDDHLLGGNGDDRLRGNEGADDLVGGSDTAGAADGQDVLLGGREDDVLVAENGIAVSEAIVDAVTDPAVPWSSTPATGPTPAAVTATTGSPLVFGASALACGPGAPTRYLTLLPDDGVAGTPVASPGTPLAYDELYGGFGCDTVLGSPGNDLVRGGQDDDLVEAGPGADIAYGDDGDDVVVGGSSVDPTRRTTFTVTRTGGAGVPDRGDEIHGDGGPDGAGGDGADLVAGDNALATRVEALATQADHVGPAYVLRLYDAATRTSAPGATTSGDDTIRADGLTDRVFGQGGRDTVDGGDGDDYLEGNDGGDSLTGGAGDDDVLGGSSTADGLPLGTTGSRLTDDLGGPFDASSAGLLDRGQDLVDAGTGADVVLGDNGRITRPSSSERHVARADETGTLDVSDGDRIAGGADDDRLLGQGGDDVVDAGPGTDHVEGNEGGDALMGGTGTDTVIGGSSLSPDGRGTLADAVTRARTQPDGDDVIEGDLATAGPVSPDLLLGDNATVLLDGSLASVQLADVGTTTSAPAALTSGDDTIRGGVPVSGSPGASDRVFGQGGDDDVTTGPADDYLEGGAGDDVVDSGAGDDDVLGGSSATDGRPLGDTGTRLTGTGEGAPSATAVRLLDGADRIDTGAGDDVVLGDNGLLTRPAGAGPRADGTRLRTVQLFDVVTATRGAVAGVGGGDTVVAAAGRDLVFGQTGSDTASGGADDDYLEGNVGDDTVTGGDGEDDIVGGGSTNLGSVITATTASTGTTTVDRLLTPVTAPTDRTASGLVDGNDAIDGGASRDVVLGDNGRITRDGPGVTLAGGASGPHVVRRVGMGDEGPGVWAGSDRLSGGLGDDDLYGQFDNTRSTRPKQSYGGQAVQGDVLDGGAGEDALVGDQGVDVPTPAAALGAVDRTVTDSSRFFGELVRPRGTLVRVVTLSQSAVGGDDLLLGGDGFDSIHAGAGKDVTNAGAGDDVVFAGDDADALWGGTGHDRLFGGAGNDLLDIKRRTSDPKLWQLAAPLEDTDRRRRTLNGRDVLYGGSGADAMQSDQGDEGTSRSVQGDRLVDWRSTINYYKVCQSGYGLGKSLRTSSSSMTSALRQLAAATGSVGSAELAIPSTERLTTYANQGSFVCETG